MTKSQFLFLCLFPFVFPFSLSALEKNVPVSQTNYIRHLVDQERYYDAISETYRYYFFSVPKSPEKQQFMNMDLGQIYLAGKSYSLARNQFFIFINNHHPNDMTRLKALRSIAWSYEEESDFANSLHAWDSYYSASTDPKGLIKAFEMSIKLFREKDASDFIKQIKVFPAAVSNPQFNFLETKWSESKKLPLRNEIAVYFLSAIPGMGQIYTGKYRDGIISFLVQVGAGLLAYERWEAKDYVTSIIIGSTDLSWYTYNFTRGPEDLYQYNKKIEKKFQASFKIPIDL